MKVDCAKCGAWQLYSRRSTGTRSTYEQARLDGWQQRTLHTETDVMHLWVCPECAPPREPDASGDAPERSGAESTAGGIK